MVTAPTREQFQKEAYPFMDEIFASALRLARQRENAEDLVSEVYSRAWKAYDRFQPGTNMRAWLYKILTNTFINHYRHDKREPGMVALDKPADPDGDGGATLYDKLADTAARPDQVLSNRFLDRDIQKAIDDLPEEFRMVVLLCDVQSFSYQDAAEMLEIPIGTVRSRLFRGRRLLQKALWDQAIATGVIGASGGKTVNCKESVKKIYEFLDGELEELPMHEIEKHLDNCRGCWDRFEFEKQLKALVKKSCSKETCTDALKKRIQSILEKY